MAKYTSNEESSITLDGVDISAFIKGVDNSKISFDKDMTFTEPIKGVYGREVPNSKLTIQRKRKWWELWKPKYIPDMEFDVKVLSIREEGDQTTINFTILNDPMIKEKP